MPRSELVLIPVQKDIINDIFNGISLYKPVSIHSYKAMEQTLGRMGSFAADKYYNILEYEKCEDKIIMKVQYENDVSYIEIGDGDFIQIHGSQDFMIIIKEALTDPVMYMMINVFKNITINKAGIFPEYENKFIN